GPNAPGGEPRSERRRGVRLNLGGADHRLALVLGTQPARQELRLGPKPDQPGDRRRGPGSLRPRLIGHGIGPVRSSSLGSPGWFREILARGPLSLRNLMEAFRR